MTPPENAARLDTCDHKECLSSDRCLYGDNARPTEPDSAATQTMTHVEWGIEFDDGDIDIMPSRSSCVEAIQIMNDEIKAGVYDEADYAGRRIVKRVVTVATTTTPWRAPGDY